MTDHRSPPEKKRESEEPPDESFDSERRQDLSEKMKESQENAKEAGRDAARALGGGFLTGAGKRWGEAVWDFIKREMEED